MVFYYNLDPIVAPPPRSTSRNGYEDSYNNSMAANRSFSHNNNNNIHNTRTSPSHPMTTSSTRQHPITLTRSSSSPNYSSSVPTSSPLSNRANNTSNNNNSNSNSNSNSISNSNSSGNINRSNLNSNRPFQPPPEVISLQENNEIGDFLSQLKNDGSRVSGRSFRGW